MIRLPNDLVVLQAVKALTVLVLIGVAFHISIYAYAQYETAGDVATSENSILQLVYNLRDSVATETKRLNEIKIRHEKRKEENEKVSTVLNSFRIQISAHNSLIYMPQAALDDLVGAAVVQEKSSEIVDEWITETTKNRKAIEEIKAQTEAQLTLYEKNKNDLSSSSITGESLKDAFDHLNQLVKLTKEKQLILSEGASLLAKQSDALFEMKKELSEQSDIFAKTIQERRTKDRFERKSYHFEGNVWTTLKSEMQHIRSQIDQLLNKTFWLETLSLFRLSDGALLLAALFLYGFFFAVLLRAKTFCTTVSSHALIVGYPWRKMAVWILCHSLLLLGTTVFLFAYTKLRNIYDNVPAVYYTIQVLLIFLSTKWALNLVKFWSDEPLPFLSTKLLRPIRTLVLTMRYLAVTYVVLDWMLLSDAIVLLILRLIIEIFILAWTMAFIRKWEEVDRKEPVARQGPSYSLERFSIYAAYILTAFPIVIELMGYGSFSTYWLASWGRSMPILLWSVLFFFILREWDQKFYSRSQDASERPAQPVKWIVFRVCWLVWGSLTIVLLILAWGEQAVFSEMGRILRYHIDIGEFQISLLGLIKVMLILFVTHALVRLWRYVLQEKFLDASGIETGVKESIVSINVYVLWCIGILISLSAFGVSGTSLTVAFGALSIGLGFGMQNIFNNFISGIIMLFERPIQVGDSVEINFFISIHC